MIRPHVLVVLAALVVPGCVSLNPAGTLAAPDLALPPEGFLGALLEKVEFTASNGLTIRGTAYLPEGAAPGARFGVILLASPYFGNYYGTTTDGLLPPTREFNKTTVGLYVGHGFAYVAVSTPGTGESGGCFSIGGKEEGKALAELVEHLAAMPWSNGNVGMMGASYDGTTPWMAAVEAPPSLKTIVPIAGITDWYRYEYFDGAPYAYWGPLFYPVYYASVGVGVAGPPRVLPDPRTLPEHVCPEAAGHFTAAAKTTMTGVHDDFWAERNYSALLGNVKASVLLVHGLQDWNVKPDHADVFEIIPGEKAALLGQWAHNIPWRNTVRPSWSRPDWNSTALAWFDHYLNGKENGIPGALPPVSVQDSDGLWRRETSWPPASATPRVLHLAPGALSEAPAPSGAAPSRFASVPDLGGTGYAPSVVRPGPASPSAIAAVFVSEPLPDDVRLAGVPRLSLSLSVDRPGNSHVVAQLYNVSEDGTWWWVNEGGRGLAQRNGRDQNEDVPRDTAMRVPVSMYPAETVFHRGERIGLVLMGEDPDWFFANGNEPVFTVHHDADRASTLTMPVLPADAPRGVESAAEAAANPYFREGVLDR